MRIAAIHLGFFYAGGGERLVLEEVLGLRRLGHQVDCYAPVVDEEACYPDLVAEVGVRRLLPAPPGWLPGRVVIWVLLSCLLAPLLAFRFRRHDVILAANQPAPWIAWVAARVLGKPYVAYLAQPLRILHPRPVDRQVPHPNLDYRISSGLARLLRPLLDWADRASVAGAAAVLANGSYMAGVLEKIYRRPMTSCPAGADPRPATRRARTAQPYLLVTNRHYPQKRFEHAIRALAALPGVRLVITGAPTDYTATVKTLATELGVGDRVDFVGLVSDAELHRLYAGASVYVYPAPEEDYGMGIVEAMAHGVPVVAWRSAGPTSTVADGATGLLVEPFDEGAFAAAIGRLLADPALAARLGRAGARLVADGFGQRSHLRVLESALQAAAGASSKRGWGLWRPLLQTAFGLLLLYLWARSLPLGQVWSHARPRRWELAALILLLTATSALVRAARWRYLLRPIQRVPLAEAFWINAGGSLINYLIPIRAGDAARVWWLQRRHRVPAGSGLATVLVDKTFDLGAVALVLAGASGYAVFTGGAPRAVAGLLGVSAAAVLLLASVLAVAVLGPRLAHSRLAARLLSPRVAEALRAQAFSFRGGAGAAAGGRFWGLAALSAVALLLDAFAFRQLFAALEVAVSTPAAMVGYVVVLLSFVLPAAPGYVGSLEVAGTLVIGGGLGLPAAAAGGAIVLWHLLGALTLMLVGGTALLVLRRPPAVAGRLPRVAVFHCGFTYSGGGERIVIEEVLGLRARGYQVECFAPTFDARACYPDLIGQVGVKTFLPQLPRRLPFREAIQMAAASALVPLYAWRFRGFDVILGANQPGAWIAWCVARLLGKRYAVYLNQPNRLLYPRPIDLETGWLTNPDYFALDAALKPLLGFVRWADNASVHGAETLLVNGRYIGDVIRAAYRRQAVDCPAGCHPVPGHPLPVQRRFEGGLEVNGFRIRRPFVLLTNRHYPQKRFDLAIRALGLLQRRHPGLQLVMPGAFTTHTPELQRLAAELGLQEQALFLGVITEQQLLNLYSEAAVYVYPAPEEDFGMGVIESMARGVPVVAWNHAGPTVTVVHGQSGYLARPGDVEDYSRGIEELLGSPEANQAFGRRAFARAQAFAWERHLDVVEAALCKRAAEPAAEVAL